MGGEGGGGGDVMKIVGFWKKRVVFLSACNDLSSTVNRSFPSFDRTGPQGVSNLEFYAQSAIMAVSGRGVLRPVT